jgi:hypothetical protein
MRTAQFFQQLPPEAQVLFLLCQTEISNEVNQRIIEQIQLSFDWDLFTKMAIRTHLAAFVYQTMRKQTAISIPEKSHQALKLYQLKIVSTNAVLFNEFDRLAEACATKGLRIIPLKGIYFAEKIYDNAPVRQLSDVDVMYYPTEKKAFLKTVQELGWEIVPYYYKSNFHKKHQVFHAPYQGVKGKLCLDIHDRFINDNFAFQFPVSTVLEKSSAISCRENKVLALDPIDCLIFTCLHAYKHLYYGDIKISSFVDINQFLIKNQHQISASKLNERCLEFNCTDEVNQILSCTLELLGIGTIELFETLTLPPINASFKQVILNTLVDKKMTTRAKINIEFIHRNTTKIGWKKIGLIWFDLFPSKEYLSIKHGKKTYLSNWMDRSFRFLKRIK